MKTAVQPNLKMMLLKQDSILMMYKPNPARPQHVQ
jgi:hypothetical protein